MLLYLGVIIFFVINFLIHEELNDNELHSNNVYYSLDTIMVQ